MKSKAFWIGCLSSALALAAGACAPIFLGACAPSLGTRVVIPELGESEVTDVALLTGRTIEVRIAQFADARAQNHLATIDGRKVVADHQLAPWVQQAFRQYLKVAGADVKLSNAPSIGGEIVQWNSEVRPAFPSSVVVARARIKIEIRDREDRVLYKAVYGGEAEVKHPFLNEDKIVETLKSAMVNAVREAVNDSSLMEALAQNG